MDGIIYFFGEYPNRKALDKASEIRTPEIGSIAYLQDDKLYYEYKDYGNWAVRKMNRDKIDLHMTVYEMNQQIISQLPAYDAEKIALAVEKIDAFEKQQNAHYYMLLCKEFSYFTIFEFDNSCIENLSHAVLDLITDIGNIKSIDNEDPNQIEIWAMVGEIAYCFHLFNYDAGVVAFGG